MTFFLKHCKNIKTILAPDTTINVHHVSAEDTTEESLQESNSATHPEMVQHTIEQVPRLLSASSLRCRTCLEVITTQRCYFLMIMGHVTKTIKEMIIFCVPQMATTLSDYDVVCYKCLHAIEFCVKFIESCLEVEEKIKNLASNEREVIIHDEFKDNNLPVTYDSMIIDHDYVIKIESDEEDSQNLVMESNSPINHQPSNADPNENVINTQPNKHTLMAPHDILKSQTFQEIKQAVLQTVTRDCFKCGYCAKSCRTENCLLDHMRRMHKTIKQPTEENKVASPTLDGTPSSSIGNPSSKLNSNCNKRPHKKFMRNEYERDPVIKCPFCVEKLRLSQMEAHLREHNQGQTEITTSATSKRRRMYRKRMLKCKTCLERFSSKDDFKLHLKMHPPYICEQCGKGFIQHSSLAAHKTTHNDPNTFICEYCGKGYRERNMLNVHLKLHENKKFECDKCPKVFKTQLHLKRHAYRVHTSFDVGQCSQCGRIFKNRSSLKSHVRLVHLKLKPYKCEICEKPFGRADYLRLHKRMHDREPTERKSQFKPGRRMRWKIIFPDSSTSSELLPCKFCGKRFQGVPKLKMHLETHVRRFPCQFCPLTFARKHYCKRHELLHNGSEDFFRCNICWKRMNSEEELEEHVEAKHNNLKYTCHICGAMFHKTFLLNQHSLREHNGSPENADNAKQIIYESLLEVTGSNET